MRNSAILHTRFRLLSLLMAITVLTSVVDLPVAAQTGREALSETIRMGGRSGWEQITLRENVMFRRGWQGGDDLALSDWGAQIDAETDLLVPFDTSLGDQTGRHTVVPDGVRIVSEPRRFGGGAAAFDGESSITYRAGPDSLLSPGTQPHAFTIEAWVYPLRVAEGSTLLLWRGALVNDGSPVFQELRLEIQNNRLVWELSNVVMNASADGRRTFESRTLSARRPVVPQRWAHHQLRFDGSTGQVSYRVNGVPETITYLTPDGREQRAVSHLYFGMDTGDGLVVGRGFRGFMDDLRITQDAGRTPQPVSYSGAPGSAYTGPIDLGPSGAQVEEIAVRALEPDLTEVRVAYRIADIVVSRNVRDALPTSWMPLPADGRLPVDARGRFIQIRFDLLADAAGRSTPRVQEAVVHYRPKLPAPAPVGVSGRSVPGGVELSWMPIRAEDIAGYRVYVGERPGRYVGTQGVRSPIDVGGDTTFTVNGLEHDRAYVFAVEAYDRHGQSGLISREIQVRAGRDQ